MRLKSDIITVQDAILRVQAWMAAGSNEVVDTIINHEVIKASCDGKVARVLVDAMQAERVISPPVRDPNTGNELAPMVTVPDHETRLSAIEQTGKMASALRAKGGNINVGIVNNPGGNGNGGATRSFEQRVRELREKNGLKNSGDELETIDAEVIEDDGADNDDEMEDESDDNNDNDDNGGAIQ